MILAKHINCIQDLNRLSADIQEIYIGNDFCDRMVLDYGFISDMYNSAQKKNLKLVIKTPFITETYIDRFCDLIKQINNDKLKISITVNDYGFLNYIYKNNLNKGIEFTLGRLLCRQKTDNITSRLKNALTEKTFQHFCTPVAVSYGYLEIVKKYNITRIELENVNNEIVIPNCLDNMRFTLLYPFVSVATTRLCPYILEHNENKLFIQDCSKECNNKKLYTSDEIQGKYVYINNTLAYKNEKILIDSLDSRIDTLLDESWR